VIILIWPGGMAFDNLMKQKQERKQRQKKKIKLLQEKKKNRKRSAEGKPVQARRDGAPGAGTRVLAAGREVNLQIVQIARWKSY